MAISTQAIRYGWVALASLGVITGTTIYVASNARKQVKPEDIIEIALGVHERCLATQTATNPTYSVDPPSIVRTWTSNVYVTNGVTVYTNIVTNTIGWHTDRTMMIDLDTKIKALCPYYVDTNSVYDGTTNIIMHTFTGLLTSLDLGNHTNFTRTPAIGTNAATYGDYPWQIYEADLVERYKVLNALKMTRRNAAVVVTNAAYKYPNNRDDFAADDINGYYAIKADFLATNWIDGTHPLGYTLGADCDNIAPQRWTMGRGRGKVTMLSGVVNSNVSVNTFQIFLNTSMTYDPSGTWKINYFDTDGMGTVPSSLLWKTYAGVDAPWSYVSDYIGNRETPVDLGTGFPDIFVCEWYVRTTTMVIDWQFNYATNKYW